MIMNNGPTDVNGKTKLKFSLCLNKRHEFLTSALGGGEWPALGPGHFTPGEGAPTTHWIVGWVGLRAGK
jgi:hypothetical protein